MTHPATSRNLVLAVVLVEQAHVSRPVGGPQLIATKGKRLAAHHGPQVGFRKATRLDCGMSGLPVDSHGY